MMLIDIAPTEVLVKEAEETISDRVLMVLHQQKRSKSWLAEQIGVSKQALNYLLMRSSKKKCINEMAVALDINPEWLKTGKGSRIINLQARDDIKFIPILSMATLKEESLGSPIKNLAVNSVYSSKCFAVVLDNHSMEPLFSEGSLLIFDPVKQPKNRDFILFSLPDDKTIYFRQFFKEGLDYYFKAVAPMYETMRHRDMILHGTLVESRHKF